MNNDEIRRIDEILEQELSQLLSTVDYRHSNDTHLDNDPAGTYENYTRYDSNIKYHSSDSNFSRPCVSQCISQYLDDSSNYDSLALNINSNMEYCISPTSLYEFSNANDMDHNTNSQQQSPAYIVDNKKDVQQIAPNISDEEKRLLALQGVVLPSDLPLTREEQKSLRTVRRKIRNKVSAKTSRKRKEEYVQRLEQRVKYSSVQNQLLTEKLNQLERINGTLMKQMTRLQFMVFKKNGGPQISGVINSSEQSRGMTTENTKDHAQYCSSRFSSGAFLGVLMLSFALFLLPSLNPLFDQSKKEIIMNRNAEDKTKQNTMLFAWIVTPEHSSDLNGTATSEYISEASQTTDCIISAFNHTLRIYSEAALSPGENGTCSSSELRNTAESEVLTVHDSAVYSKVQ